MSPAGEGPAEGEVASVLVFLPATPASARALRSTGQAAGLRGFAVTPTLSRTLGADVSDEEADYAALSSAGVAALDGLGTGRRLVLAADLPADQVADLGDDLGEVRVVRLGWAQVQALFADEDAAADAVRAAAAEATGRTAADALTGPAVAALTDGHDLLWYAPEELDALAEDQP